MPTLFLIATFSSIFAGSKKELQIENEAQEEAQIQVITSVL